jgi:hypothetical protein
MITAGKQAQLGHPAEATVSVPSLLIGPLGLRRP